MKEKSNGLEATKKMFDEFFSKNSSDKKDKKPSANSGRYIELRVIRTEKLEKSKK